MNNRLTIFAAIFCAIATNTFATDTIPSAEREKAATALTQVIGSTVSPEMILTTSLPGVFEARLLSGPVYVSKDGSWVLRGDLINVATKENIPQQSITEMQKVKFSAIPLDGAIKIVNGNGSRKLITFEDPNCGYCKKFAGELQNITNVTVYIQPVAMIAPTSMEKDINILCSDNPAVAWQDAMLKNKDATPCKADAKKEMARKKIQSIQALAEKYFINGTPTLLFEDDTRTNGGMSMNDLENRLTQASKTVADGKGKAKK